MFKNLDINAIVGTIGGAVILAQTILSIILAKWPKLDSKTKGILGKLGKANVTDIIDSARIMVAAGPNARKEWAIKKIQMLAAEKNVKVSASQLNSIIEWGVRTVKKSLGQD